MQKDRQNVSQLNQDEDQSISQSPMEFLSNKIFEDSFSYFKSNISQ